MKKIIHLSDLHAGARNRKRYGGADLTRVFSRIVDNIRQSAVIERQSAVVVITGDIVHRVSRRNYDDVSAKLLELTNDGFEVFLVPGNHDYKKGKLYQKKNICDFQHAFHELLFKDRSYQNGERKKQFPILNIVDEGRDHAIALIGLNSMAGRFRRFRFVRIGTGSFGEKQLKRLDCMLADPRVVKARKRVIYFHHRLFSANGKPEIDEIRKLQDVVMKHDALGTRTDAILYGHKHAGIEENGLWEIVQRCYDGSSSTGRRRKDKVKPVVQRVIDLSSDNPAADDFNGNFHL
ncbi:metallophosphoesterase [bacterium]|nr:metallophosphoesterase [bacterium]